VRLSEFVAKMESGYTRHAKYNRESYGNASTRFKHEVQPEAYSMEKVQKERLGCDAAPN
jgi:hypothetical protein